MSRRLDADAVAALLPDDPLAAIDLLAGLDAVERALVAKDCRFFRVEAGTRVIDDDTGGSTGDRAGDRNVLFVIEGRVRVVDETSDGRTVTYAEIAAGSLVGELAALDGGPRTAAVLALTDCLVAMLGADHFVDLLTRRPPLALGLLRHLVRIIREADARITELSTVGAAGRLCRELLRRSRPASDTDGTRRVVEPLPTSEELASLIGVTRERVSRLLGQLEQAGLLAHAARHLLLTDIQRLADLAGLRRSEVEDLATSMKKDGTGACCQSTKKRS